METNRACVTRDTRVLWVDDHEPIRRILGRLLRTVARIDVVGEAENGLAAQEMTESLSPDVVIMDVQMPVMNGIEATTSHRV